MTDKEFDLFICYASEDKADLVEPLKAILGRLGLRVWYDADEIKVGDSLSASIDAGLTQSRFAVVVVSESFIEKGWPAYELRGLVARENRQGSKIVLPIWKDISVESVERFSPPLAGKRALKSPEETIQSIALSILREVRPALADKLMRYVQYRAMVENTPPQEVALNTLQTGPVRHEQLTPTQVIRARLIFAVLHEPAPTSLPIFIDCLKRDVNPNHELAAWEQIAITYLHMHSIIKGDGGEVDPRRIFETIMHISLQSEATFLEMLESDREPMHTYTRVFGSVRLEPQPGPAPVVAPDEAES